MASRRPKLPPEDSPPAPRRPPLVHVVPTEEGWAVRIGRRIETTFATQYEAVRAGMPRARQLSSRLLVHKQDGTIREAATSEDDEMLLEVFRRTYESHAQRTD